MFRIEKCEVCEKENMPCVQTSLNGNICKKCLKALILDCKTDLKEFNSEFTEVNKLDSEAEDFLKEKYNEIFGKK